MSPTMQSVPLLAPADLAALNGRVYDFHAEHLGDGVWRVNRVAGRT